MEIREPTLNLALEHRIQNWVAPIGRNSTAIPVGVDSIWFAQPTGYAVQVFRKDGRLFYRPDFLDPEYESYPLDPGINDALGYEDIDIAVPLGEISHIEAFVSKETPGNKVIACIGGIVRSVRQQAQLILARSMQLLKDSRCDIEFCDQTSDTVAVMTFYGQLLGNIIKDKEKLMFENRISGQAVELHEGENPIGLLYQPPNFFGNGDLLREVIADSHGCIEIKNEGGKTFLRITTGYGLKISLLPKHLLRGEESAITELHPSPNLARFAICNNVDGYLDFPDADMWGLTEIGGRIETGNEDGIYINPEARVIAGADGMGGEAYGELASSFALASVHSNTLAPQDNWLNELDNIAPNACADLAEGFTVGDYKALLVDLKTGKVLYESVDQSTEEFVDNCISPNGLLKDPVYFSYELQDSQEVAVVLYSDGVSFSVKPEEVADSVCRFRGKSIDQIAKTARQRHIPQTRDNISICLMITHERSECAL